MRNSSVEEMNSGIRWQHLWDVFAVFLLIIVIGVADVNRVLAVIFTHDHFYHLDSMLMAPGWAHLKGLTLNVDVISQYSMVIPVVVSRLADAVGGFSYQSVLTVLIALVTLYFIAFYWLLRTWLGSVLWAIFGVLLAVKLHMFHDGVAPVVWRYPSATVLRYVFDIIAFYAVSRHCVTYQRRYLWIAFAVAGISLAYMMDTGLYLLFALYVYLTAYLLVGSRQGPAINMLKEWPRVLWLFIMPFVIALGVLFLVQGPAIFTQQMWGNAFEFAGFFMQGWGAMPMHEVLRDRQFFAFFMGFFIPAVYVWTLIFVGGKCLTGQAPWKDVFVVFLSVYGLCLYQYFINRSALSSYYAVCLPYAGVVCYWLRALSEKLSLGVRWTFSLASIGLVVLFLGTNVWFGSYPNIWHSTAQQWAKESQAFREEFNFERDAQLIRELTAPDERVALICNFETAILMGSGRKPFFYLFPLVESARMDLPVVGRNYLYTQERLARTLQQINDKKPAYIFVETRFLRAYENGSQQTSGTLRELMKNVLRHYRYETEGQYLTALKRGI